MIGSGWSAGTSRQPSGSWNVRLSMPDSSISAVHSTWITSSTTLPDGNNDVIGGHVTTSGDVTDFVTFSGVDDVAVVGHDVVMRSDDVIDLRGANDVVTSQFTGGDFMDFNDVAVDDVEDVE